ncbi:MAG: leucyl aminopeptidase family protein [Hyphomicrobiaceae bacterium]
MADTRALRAADVVDVLADPAGAGDAIPIRLVAEGHDLAGHLDERSRAWAAALGFTGAARKHVIVPGSDGRIAAVLLGTGRGATGEPCGPAALLAGLLPGVLPAGTYRLEGVADGELAAIAWGLGAYRFTPYRSDPAPQSLPRLAIPEGTDALRVRAAVEAVWLGRDLINTPASDLGPAELEAAARSVAERHGAKVTSIVGDDLLTQNFPMIHAVGRASPRAPRLVDLTWGRAQAPRLTVVGKGIVFDTGGLDIKTTAGMALMKKDMGGAASALAIAHMIMAEGIDVRLRVLLPIAENSISGNAFRPGDILKSRSGKTVEIGSTDAEGRLVLADALALADEEAPDLMISLATLTGAARVALGPDLPALYTDDDGLAGALTAAGAAIGDPAWRMPFWPGYERFFDSEIADMNNAGESPFAGSITAALFLRRYVRQAKRFAHVDLYGWRPTPRALGPKGGEPHLARALVALARAGGVRASEETRS